MPIHKLKPKELHPLAVVAQSLDNQWAPPDVLAGEDAEQSTRDVISQQRARDEYVRALVNAPQVVINRAFLYNNPAVYRDFARTSPDRAAFTELLNSAAIIPFLMGERTPDVAPSFTTLSPGFDGWQEVVGDSHPTCLRMSWDDEQNDLLVCALRDSFAEYAMRLGRLDRSNLAQHLGIQTSNQAEALQQRLHDVGVFAESQLGEGSSVTRETLYREFVVKAGTRPADRDYDLGKPFALQIKQLVDLAYSVNTAERLETYALTPAGSLRRTVLQEWSEEDAHATLPVVDAVELERIVRTCVFGALQEALTPRLQEVTLRDVLALRATPEWASHAASMHDLLSDPRDALQSRSDAPVAVLDGYSRMLQKLSGIVSNRRAEAVIGTWTPTAGLTLEVAGAVLSFAFGKNATYSIAGTIAASAANHAAPVAVRWLVKAASPAFAPHHLEISTKILEMRFERAGQEWDKLIKAIRDSPGLHEIPATTANQADVDGAFNE